MNRFLWNFAIVVEPSTKRSGGSSESTAWKIATAVADGSPKSPGLNDERIASTSSAASRSDSAELFVTVRGEGRRGEVCFGDEIQIGRMHRLGGLAEAVE